MKNEMMVTNQAVATTDTMSLKSIVDRVNIVHQIMSKVMQKGTHFGQVPGCGSKMVLLKPGADLLAMTFRLAPEYRIERTDMGNGHREYEVTCIMRGPDGTVVGEGVGSGSTMEGKYRYRKDGSGNKGEHPDIADVYNTVLKMAKKRAHIDATLTCTGASDMFTQDLIDDEDKQRKPVAEPKVKKEKTKTPEPETPITGMIEDVEVKKGGTQQKPWTRYGITIDGETYGTFDTKIGDAAGAAIGNVCNATYKTDGKYKTLISLSIEKDDLEELFSD